MHRGMQEEGEGEGKGEKEDTLCMLSIDGNL